MANGEDTSRHPNRSAFEALKRTVKGQHGDASGRGLAAPLPTSNPKVDPKDSRRADRPFKGRHGPFDPRTSSPTKEDRSALPGAAEKRFGRMMGGLGNFRPAIENQINEASRLGNQSIRPPRDTEEPSVAIDVNTGQARSTGRNERDSSVGLHANRPDTGSTSYNPVRPERKDPRTQGDNPGYKVQTDAVRAGGQRSEMRWDQTGVPSNKKIIRAEVTKDVPTTGELRRSSWKKAVGRTGTVSGPKESYAGRGGKLLYRGDNNGRTSEDSQGLMPKPGTTFNVKGKSKRQMLVSPQKSTGGYGTFYGQPEAVIQHAEQGITLDAMKGNLMGNDTKAARKAPKLPDTGNTPPANTDRTSKPPSYTAKAKNPVPNSPIMNIKEVGGIGGTYDPKTKATKGATADFGPRTTTPVSVYKEGEPGERPPKSEEMVRKIGKPAADARQRPVEKSPIPLSTAKSPSGRMLADEREAAVRKKPTDSVSSPAKESIFSGPKPFTGKVTNLPERTPYASGDEGDPDAKAPKIRGKAPKIIRPERSTKAVAKRAEKKATAKPAAKTTVKATVKKADTPANDNAAYFAEQRAKDAARAESFQNRGKTAAKAPSKRSKKA